MEVEGATVGPAGVLGGQPLRLDAQPVAVEGLLSATALVSRVGEPAQRGRQLPKRGRPQRVDPALARTLRGDEPRALQGLQVLGRLRLPRPGQLGEHPDRAGPLGEQADQPPARRVGQSGEQCVHSPSILPHAYSCQGIFRGDCGGLGPGTGRPDGGSVVPFATNLAQNPADRTGVAGRRDTPGKAPRSTHRTSSEVQEGWWQSRAMPLPATLMAPLCVKTLPVVGF